jgi:5S rRNA maturation endonuclease (ribonuclease M5)|tara:strand:+ start:1726 stop:2688 length:963 start_codon:yes stop_codon:yes gene_type:complete
MSIITLKQKRELISSVFGKGVVASNGSDIAVYCPVCEKSSKTKKKRKLSISIETGVYHCWVCESKGKLIARFVQINFPNSKQLPTFKEYFGNFKESEVKEEKIVLKLPEDFKLLVLSDSKKAKRLKKYLLNRGMDFEDLYQFKAGYSAGIGFENRVIFPSFDSELNLNFYLTRVCEETKYQKYKNCKASKKEIIFNEHLIDWNSPIILVEGVFDAVKAGKNAVPVLGSWVDTKYEVFKKIIEKKCDVILALDPDAKGKQIKISENLISYGIDVKNTQNLEKDLGDMTKKEVQNLILNAKPFDSMERMRYLIRGIKSGSIF